MPKGNWSNHAKKYAYIEDVARIEQELHHFLNNDWPHSVKKMDKLLKAINKMSIRLWILVGAMSVLIPLAIVIIQSKLGG